MLFGGLPGLCSVKHSVRLQPPFSSPDRYKHWATARRCEREEKHDLLYLKKYFPSLQDLWNLCTIEFNIIPLHLHGIIISRRSSVRLPKEPISNIHVAKIAQLKITRGLFNPFLSFLNSTSLSLPYKHSPGHSAAEHSTFIKVLLSEACISLQPPCIDNLISSAHLRGAAATLLIVNR